MNGYAAIDAALRGLAGWAEDELAAHQPPAWVAQQQAEGIRHIAWVAGLAGKGTLSPEALDTMLGAGDGNTMMLGTRGTPEAAAGRRRGGWSLRARGIMRRLRG